MASIKSCHGERHHSCDRRYFPNWCAMFARQHVQTGGVRLGDVGLAEANELALYTLPLSASAIPMASADSAPASTKEQASTFPSPSYTAGVFTKRTNCAQDSKGTEPQAVVEVTQLTGAQGSQNDTTQATQSPATTQQARDDVPNGAVNASGDQPAATTLAGPAPSTSAQPAQAAAGAVSVVASASSSALAPNRGGKADEMAKPKDAEKDRASLNTSTHTYARSQSTRQKETKSVSELAHTASTAAEEPKKTKTSSKKAKAKGDKTKGSLFSRLFHVFVPCVGPSNKAHQIDLDIEKPRPVEPAVPTTTELKEKQIAKEAEELPPKPSTSEVTTPPEEVPKPSEQEEPRGTPAPPPLQPVDIPPPSDDPSVVVPPTPTKTLLPREEGGGVLSGSVQPIGSTGEEIAQEQRHRDSDHESDGSTSFTDEEEVEEPSPIDEVEDEEERLIMNGGAGIPVGPVRISLRTA